MTAMANENEFLVGIGVRIVPAGLSEEKKYVRASFDSLTGGGRGCGAGLRQPD